jgi:hypothetical protein
MPPRNNMNKKSGGGSSSSGSGSGSGALTTVKPKPKPKKPKVRFSFLSSVAVPSSSSFFKNHTAKTTHDHKLPRLQLRRQQRADDETSEKKMKALPSSSSAAADEPTKKKMKLPADVLRMCLAELFLAPRTLLVLSSVSREMWRLIRHNHALLRHVYLHCYQWSYSHWYSVTSIMPPMHGMWTPKRTWETEGVPRAERSRFNAYVYRVMVMRYTRRCSLCGATWNDDLDEGCRTSIWALGLIACSVCLRANLISHRALWFDYGVWLGGSLPTRTPAVSLAIEQPRYLKGTVFDMMRASVFMFVDGSASVARRRFTSHPADLGRSARDRETDTLFMWRPHLNRVLRLDKARAVMPLRIAAANKLKAYARLLEVQRLLKPMQKKPLGTVLERLLSRDLRPAWPLLAGTHCYFEKFNLRPTGEKVRSFRDILGWNPHYTAALRRAWAPLSGSDRGVFL